MTKVKICGITNFEDARLAVEFGADMIGFNFFPCSKRYIDEGYAESIVERLMAPVIKVGVFVNQTFEDIMDAEGIAELDMLQLHGDERQELVEQLRVETDAKIIKVFRVGPDFDAAAIDEYDVDAVMLDSFSTAEFGGTGKALDWDIAAKIAESVQTVYLAGGLNPENIVDAVRIVRPYAVDVASGVELAPGKKDPKKLEAFIKNAKNA